LGEINAAEKGLQPQDNFQEHLDRDESRQAAEAGDCHRTKHGEESKAEGQMTDFPTIVYRCPGDRWGPPYTTFNSIGVTNQEAFDKALADGWFATLPEAVEVFLNPAPARVAVVSEPVEDNAPPTRDEMLAKAAEIGLTVDRRWSDKTLANKIIEALEAQEAAEAAAPEPTPEAPPEPAPDPEPTP
jgi:hypothetical protein